LTDLTFIEEGNHDYLEDRVDFKNFEKCKKIALVISNILKQQQASYLLTPVQAIQDYLSRLNRLDTNTAYQLSLTIEPRS